MPEYYIVYFLERHGAVVVDIVDANDEAEARKVLNENKEKYGEFIKNKFGDEQVLSVYIDTP